MHRRSPPAEGRQRRHRRRHRKAADRLRLPCPDHELSGAGHADDRADRIRIPGGARPLLRRHDRDPARDREIEQGRWKVEASPLRHARTRCTTSPTMRGPAPTPRRRLFPAGTSRTDKYWSPVGRVDMSMATATWCARARRWRITRRRGVRSKRHSGRCAASNPESRDSPMRNCASEVWSFGPSRKWTER